MFFDNELSLDIWNKKYRFRGESEEEWFDRISGGNEGDVVFDPFVGSGTTCKMAKLNNRKYIGIDISEEYCDIARKRLEECE